MQSIGLPKDLSDFFFDQALAYPALETLEHDKLDETNALYKAELDAIGLLHNDAYSNPDKIGIVAKLAKGAKAPNGFQLVDSSGKYQGVVLKFLFDEIEEIGLPAFEAKMMDLLGYDHRELKAHWFENLYEYFQMQMAFAEEDNPHAAALRAAQAGKALEPSLLDVAPAVRPGPEEIPHSVHLPRGPDDVLWQAKHPGQRYQPPFAAVVFHGIQGFPQGGALSPLFWNFVFEYILVRRLFEPLQSKVKNLKMKIVAYADDFIIFVNKAINLRDLFKGNEAMRSMGLSFNEEKSFMSVIDGRPVKKSFKFLGVTHYFRSGATVGTPRSGKELLFDKAATVRDFDRRHVLLRRIAKFLKWDVHPQVILEGWADGIHPYAQIPYEVISGDCRHLSKVQLAQLRDQIREVDFDLQVDEINREAVLSGDAYAHPHADFIVDEDGIAESTVPFGTALVKADPSAPTGFALLSPETQAAAASVTSGSVRKRKPNWASNLEANRGNSGPLDAGFASYPAGRSKRGPLAWLSSPLAGYMLNRLHSGDWISADELADPAVVKSSTLLRSHPRTAGRSLLGMLKALPPTHPLSPLGVSASIFNSSSYSTYVLLEYASGKSLKLAKRGLRTNIAPPGQIRSRDLYSGSNTKSNP